MVDQTDEPEITPPVEADEGNETAPESPNEVSLADISWQDLLKDEVEETPEESTEDVAEETPASDAGDEPQAEEESESEPAPEETPDEPQKKDITPELVQKLFEENRQLLRLKGKQGAELGAARDRVAELEARLARLEKGGIEDEETSEVPQTEDEWNMLFQTQPAKAMELYEAEKARKAQAEAARKKSEEAQETMALTPKVGAELFIRQNGIEDFDKWGESPEGVAVQQVIASDRKAKAAMLTAFQVGDAELVAEIMSEGLAAVRAAATATKAKQVVATQKAKADAAKPTSLPRPGRAVTPSAPKSLANVSSQDLLKMSDEEFVRTLRGK